MLINYIFNAPTHTDTFRFLCFMGCFNGHYIFILYKLYILYRSGTDALPIGGSRKQDDEREHFNDRNQEVITLKFTFTFRHDNEQREQAVYY